MADAPAPEPAAVFDERGVVRVHGNVSPPFSPLTLRTWEADVSEYPPGVPFLDYKVQEEWWALEGEGSAWSLKQLADTVASEETLLLRPKLLSAVHLATLFVQGPMNFQNMALPAFTETLMEHLAKECIAPQHLPVNALCAKDVFMHPIKAWRAGDSKEAWVCLKVKMHHEARGGGGYKLGHVSEFGNSRNYRQLLLGQAVDGEHVWMPLHMLLVLLRDGPYSMLTSALEAREPWLQDVKGWMREVQVDCMHLGACQAAKSANCIGPYCLAYGTRKLNKEMADQYRKTCGHKRPRGSRLFQRSPWVAEARSLLRSHEPGQAPRTSSAYQDEHKQWIAKQAALKTLRRNLVDQLEARRANAIEAAAVHRQGQQIQSNVSNAVQALADASA